MKCTCSPVPWLLSGTLGDKRSGGACHKSCSKPCRTKAQFVTTARKEGAGEHAILQPVSYDFTVSETRQLGFSHWWLHSCWGEVYNFQHTVPLLSIYRFRMHYPPAHLKPSKGALKPYGQVKLTITTTKVLCWKHTIFVKLLVILHATDHISYVRACTALQSSAQHCKTLG